MTATYVLLYGNYSYLFFKIPFPNEKKFQSTSENSKDNFYLQPFFERDSKSLVNSFSVYIYVS